MSDQARDSGGTTVAEAARVLGISEGAVRKRVERGKLAADHTQDGRLIVYLEGGASATTATDTTRDRPRQSHDDRYTRSLEEQVEYLRRQLERRDEELREHRRLLAGLIERVPELEAAPSDERGSPVTDAEEPARVEDQPRTTSPQTGAQRVPWWRRIIGG